MRIPTVVLLVFLALVVLFAGANWSAISAPTTVSLMVTTIQAPLGLIMVGITAVATVLFLGYAVYLQGSVLLIVRRHGRELQAQRDLADKAEASRFTALREHLDVEMRKISDAVEQGRAQVASRVDLAERELRTSIEQSGNSLAAYIGELEDRLHPPATGPLGEQTALR